jgi:hypothetical protein
MKLIKKEFAAWLKNRYPNRSVGECLNQGKCALAAYLNDRSGRAVWRVDVDEIEREHYEGRGYDGDNYTSYKTPSWASKFIRAYDCSERSAGERTLAPTAAECLKILRTGKAVKRA